MKRVLFIDRDGTLILEPSLDKQVDSLEKLSFIPEVFSGLSSVVKFLNYELVMVSNQDGLGTRSFPEETFWPAHNKMMEALAGEGIVFNEVLIDRSFPEDKSPGRKPATGLVEKYLNDSSYDLKNSFVIGDRQTDIEFAANIGAKAIQFLPPGAERKEIEPEEIEQEEIEAFSKDGIALRTSSWREIYRFLRSNERKASCSRVTNETSIQATLLLDGNGKSDISTGLGFFDHMLEQIVKHSACDLSLQVKGDLQVDEHHTIEDTGLLLGEAVLQALGDKIGIERYSFLLPMDESIAQVALDFSGRAHLEWNADFKREKIGDMPTEMFSHFFKSFCDTAKCTLHIKAEGKNEHHKIEGIFKAFAKCLSQAWKLDIEVDRLPSSKGVL